MLWVSLYLWDAKLVKLLKRMSHTFVYFDWLFFWLLQWCLEFLHLNFFVDGISKLSISQKKVFLFNFLLFLDDKLMQYWCASLHSLRGKRVRGRRWHQPLQWPRSMRPRKPWILCLRRGPRTLALVSNNRTPDEIESMRLGLFQM